MKMGQLERENYCRNMSTVRLCWMSASGRTKTRSTQLGWIGTLGSEYIPIKHTQWPRYGRVTNLILIPCRIDLNTGEQTVLSSHEAGVSSIVYSRELNIIISSSWDSTLHIHLATDLQALPVIVPLPSKPFSIAATATKLVVSMASRSLHIYDLKALALLTAQLDSTVPGDNRVEVEPWQRRESSLKFMTRAIACMLDDSGYATSSIEGRVAVEWFDPSPESQARKYAFKCHRQTAEDGVDVVYPVNALAFHPVFGTFASGGSDGVVYFWDGVNKRRIRQYPPYGTSVSALAFSNSGQHLAVAVSPGFEDGRDEVSEGSVMIYVRELGETEAKSKFAK